MISYAQNGEDVILARALDRGVPGFYVDVGAASPTDATVTRHFYEGGWRGLNVEPVPKWAAALRALRPRDVTVEAAAGSASGELVFFEAIDDPALSTSDADSAARLIAEGHRLRRLPMAVVTLDEVLAEVRPEAIDFLKIDVEGAEREVLAGIDLPRWRPRVVLVEATEPNSLRPSYGAWEDLVTGRGYVYASTDGINRYYVREEEQPLAELLVPVNSLDDCRTMREQLLLDEIERLRVYAHSLELGRQRLAGELAVAGEELRAATERLRTGRRASAAPAPSRPAVLADPPIERVAVLSSPGSGAQVLAGAVAVALGCRESVAEHPADLRLEHLPERAVVHLVWPRTPRLRALLRQHGFQVVTVARHPFDTLLALLRLVQVEPAASHWLEGGDEEGLEGAMPTDEAFIAWATGARATALLEVSASWWEEPGTWRVRFPELAEDLDGVARQIFLLFHPFAGHQLAPAVSPDAVELPPSERPPDGAGRARAGAGGAGRRKPELGLEDLLVGWRAYLTAEGATRLAHAHGGLLGRLGWAAPPVLGGLPDDAAARRAWNSLTAGVPA